MGEERAIRIALKMRGVSITCVFVIRGLITLIVFRKMLRLSIRRRILSLIVEGRC